MKNYEINSQTLAVFPYENEKTKVIEEDDEFIVNCSIMKVIEDSCRYFGSSYQGRVHGTKNILGISHKSPIIIEESSGMIFFPTASPRLEECSWVSLNNIDYYSKSGKNTLIKFSCGKQIKIELSYGIFDNQVLRATRLQVLLKKRLRNIEKIA